MIGAAAATVAAGLAILVGTSPASAAEPVHVTAPGQVVRVVVAGFAPGTVVVERRSDRGAGGRRRADARGRVVVTHRAPAAPGRYTLTEIGDPPGQFRRGSARPGSAQRDEQVLQVVVPRIVVIPILVRRAAAGGSGVLGTGAVRTGQQDAALAATGSDLRWPLGLAFGGLAVGGVLLVAGRRRVGAGGQRVVSVGSWTA